MAVGSGATWAVAELGFLPSGLVAAILSTGTGIIYLADWAGNNNGIIVGFTWTGTPTIMPN